MLDKKTVETLKESLTFEDTPVLSLYVDINPAKPENARRAYALRAKDAFKALGVLEIAEKVEQILRNEVLEAKTAAFFATHGTLKTLLFQVELPLTNRHATYLDESKRWYLTEGVLAHYGEPLLFPLLYALDEYERYGVVYLDGEKWRYLEVFMGEVEEIHDAFLALDTEAWRRLSLDAPGRRFGLGGISRGGAGQDLFAKRLEAWQERFYKTLVRELEHLAATRGFTRLILMGPEEHTELFLGYLPRRLKEQVVAELPSLPNPKASPGQVLKRLEPLIEEIERKREVELLNKLEEAHPKSAFGPEVLRLVQEGRVELWVLPWTLDQEVYPCGDFFFMDRGEAMAFCQNPEAKPLAAVLPELALGYASKVEFVRGEAEKRLNERGRMAALLRW
ncbi:MAG: VLRF1 family aeRF1-type release factor [Thermaceae bacterium]